MCSKPRIIVPNAFYYISTIGVPNLKMFRDSRFRNTFLTILDRYLKKFNYTCYAYSFTINQYHLVLKTSDQAISKFMQQLNSVVAKNYNICYKRSDAVFGRRYNSLVAADIQSTKEFIRFVHLEPLRAGECTLDELDWYEWSSHSLLCGKNKQTTVFKADEVLKLFSGPQPAQCYREFLYSGWPQSLDDETVNSILAATRAQQGFRKVNFYIVGDPKLVMALLFIDQCRRQRVARYLKEQISLKNIQQKVEELMVMTPDHLKQSGRCNEHSTARELFCYVARLRYDFSNAEIARHLNVNESTVSKMISRFYSVENKEYLIQEVVFALSGEECYTL